MAIALLGVVWFKFVEENLDSCQPVHFHSSQCTFPEFPGCFYCDKSSKVYIAALRFHYTCSIIAGVLALSIVAKVLLATRVVLDEMSSPTTSSPAGLLCMTTVCVFAGKGLVGQLLVSAATCVHLCIVIWFMYMALAYHIMPEPSWFPNTVGIGLSAVKTWLYYPMTGQVLMAVRKNIWASPSPHVLLASTQLILSLADVVDVHVFLLPNKPDQSYPECKNFCSCRLDADECTSDCSLRSDYHGATFIQRRTPRYYQFSARSSYDLLTVHAFLVCSFRDRVCFKLTESMCPLERISEEAIFTSLFSVLLSNTFTCQRNSSLPRGVEFFF